MRFFKKISEYAPGIPSRDKITAYPTVTDRSTPFMVPAVLHKHDALRAGLHYDLRLVNPESGVAHSWAIRKGLPDPGAIHLAIQQPDHTEKYLDFEGTIPEGYGAGEVVKDIRGEANIIYADDSKIKFELDNRSFVLINTDGTKWIIRGLS